MVEFLHSLDRNVVEGMGQAAVAIALCLGVVFYAAGSGFTSSARPSCRWPAA